MNERVTTKVLIEGCSNEPLQHYSLLWANQSEDSLQAEELQGETSQLQQTGLLPVSVPSH